MKKHLSLVFALCVAFGNSFAKADGVLYQLPKDGTSVTYKVQLTQYPDDNKMETNGTIKVSSVGKETIDKEVCRWIEFHLKLQQMGKDQVMIVKFLIPEKHIKKGKDPFNNVKKAWASTGGQEATKITDMSTQRKGPFYMLLQGPSKSEKKLSETTVECTLGKLKCEGVHGSSLYVEDDGREANIEHETWFSKKAPFGIVKTTFKVVPKHNPTRPVSIALELVKVGKNAKSEMKIAE